LWFGIISPLSFFPGVWGVSPTHKHKPTNVLMSCEQDIYKYIFINKKEYEE